ncbi:hypothetical protein G6F31_015242 [Rhizopus arrhizus]|nr:hypothetical protein G6F31_015242 [Rhizopus arrhizus]
MHDTLSGQNAEQRDRDRRVLANDITQLRLLSTHVPFATRHLRWTSGAVRAMQDQISALTPAVSAVEDRLRALQANDQPLPEPVSALLHDISEWINAGAQASHETAVQLRAAVTALTPAIDSHSTWRDALLASLMTRLGRLWERGRLPSESEVRRLFEARLTDVAANKLARRWCEQYSAADGKDRRLMLAALAQVRATYAGEGGEGTRLFKRFNAQAQGLRFLVELRADMLRWRKQVAGIQSLDKELEGLLSACRA